MEEIPQQTYNEPEQGAIPEFMRPAPPPPPAPSPAYPGVQMILPTWVKGLLIGGILIFFLASIIGSAYTLSTVEDRYDYDYESRTTWTFLIVMISQIGVFMMSFACFFMAFIKSDVDIRVRKGFLIGFILFMFLLSYTSWISMATMW